MNANTTDVPDIAPQRMSAIHDLFADYVRVVDGKQLEEWPELFAREARYFVIPRENHERGLPLALIYDDSRDRIEDRVAYVRRVWVDHYDEYQPRHFLSSIRVRAVENDEFLATANMAVYMTMVDGTTELLAVGEYVDMVIFEDNVARFREKKVILDTSVLPRSFVYPL